MQNKLLAIPHIGTAFGHFYRTAEFVKQYIEDYEVYFIVPQVYYDYCRLFVDKRIQLVPRKIHCSISSRSGKLDTSMYSLLLKENEKIFERIDPCLIIGDPGIQASILGTKYSIEWVGLMHGCYLPFPRQINLNVDYYNLLLLVWSRLNYQLDKLIILGSKNRFDSWDSIRNTGKIFIPTQPQDEPSKIGSYINLNEHINDNWKKHEAVDLLVTCCSAGSVIPSYEFLNDLSNKTDLMVTVAGTDFNLLYGKNNFIGKNVNYKYLVNKNTTVITHGGHGTIQSIKNAKDVFMIPSDLDQLYNSIIAFATKNWKIIFDKDWIDILNGTQLFRREIYWDRLKVINIDGKLDIEGVNIFRGKECLEEITR